MNNTCKIIEQLTSRINNGEKVDDILPYDLNASDEIYKEVLLLYIKYGEDEKRVHACMEKLKEYDL